SNSPTVMYRQVLAFGKQSQNAFCLKAAGKVFGKIVEMKPDFFDAWHGWSNTLVRLGVCSNEMSPFQEALSKFSCAEKLTDKICSTKLAAYYRDWGACWYFLGKLSGEAYDFRNSINMFHRASEFGQNDPRFWNDYGTSLVELSALINKPFLLIKAVELYWKVIKQAPDYYEGWINLGTSLYSLYQIYPQEAYFALANESFDKASKLDPQQADLWIQWGQLHAFRGKITKDIERLQDSCKKFEIADICGPNHHVIFSSWSEALMLIGSWTDDLSLLHKSLKNVIKSLEIQPDNTSVWGLYGRCLNEFGRYFNDENYYLHAIDKFRYGLTLDPQDHLLWYGLALAVFAIGQHRSDMDLIEESAQCCIKVIECGGHALPEFWNDWGIVLMKLAHMTDEKRYIEAALKKFEQAIRLRRESQAREPVDPEWLYNYGCALEFLGDYNDDVALFEQAVQVLKKVLDIDPSYHPVYFNLATVFSHLGELTADLDYFREALKNFERYLSIDIEDDFAWGEWGMTLLNLALLIKDPSMPDEAYRYFCEAENKFMQAVALGNTPALYNLACLYSLAGNDSSSIHFLERAKENQVLPCIDDLLEDEWLEGVRKTPDFRHFLSHIQRKGIS
ncbi:MAG: tetratricopeptide repeat protein, partial [Waddliaceae bacterium]